MQNYNIKYTELSGGGIPNIVHKVLRSNTYITRDKKCKCTTACNDNGDRSWCFVNESCKGAVNGWRGYYKPCDPNNRYTEYDAEQEIIRVERDRLDRDRTKREKEDILYEEQQRKYEEEIQEKLRREEIERVRIEQYYKPILEKSIPNLIITKLLRVNISLVFIGTYDTKNVIVKILSSFGLKNKEWEMQRIAAANNLAPQVLSAKKITNNDKSIYVIVMDYLSNNWISYNEVTRDKIREYNIDIDTIKTNMCNKVDELHRLNLDHGTLKDDNILINYVTNDVMFIDFEEAIIAKSDDEIHTMNRNYSEFKQNRC